jgi:hypothetical protein
MAKRNQTASFISVGAGCIFIGFGVKKSLETLDLTPGAPHTTEGAPEVIAALS